MTSVLGLLLLILFFFDVPSQDDYYPLLGLT
jgi:hypothetical protein